MTERLMFKTPQAAMLAITECVKSKRYRDVIVHASHAVKQYPVLQKHTEFCEHVYNALFELGFYKQSVKYALLTSQLQPASSRAMFNVARALLACQRYSDAAAWVNKAELLEPDYAQNLLARSFIHLTFGQYNEGWSLYEQRKNVEGFTQRKVNNVPVWAGFQTHPIQGKSIFVSCEQGLGDTLMFVRYAIGIAVAGGHVILLVQSRLQSWLSQMVKTYGNAGGRIEAVVADGQKVRKTDYWVPLPSLPALMQLKSLPPAPYLQADTVGLSGPNPAGKLRVGIAWAGSDENSRNMRRSFQFRDLALLLDVPNVQFYSLQMGAALEPAKAHPSWHKVIELDNPTDGFLHTARQIASLDLVITVCTSVLHAAGAQGKPFWALLDSAAEWRNGTPRATVHPFYTNSRLYREPARGYKRATVLRLKNDLMQLARKHQEKSHQVQAMLPQPEKAQKLEFEATELWSGEWLKVKRFGTGLLAFNAYDTRSSAFQDFEHLFQSQFLRVFKTLLPADAAVIEVGAYLGLQTIGMAGHVTKGQILAFEGSRLGYELLHTNMTLNELRQVRVQRAIVMHESGKKRVVPQNYTQAADFGAASFFDAPERGEVVPCLKLSDLPLTRVDCICIDVNGMEVEVVQGALRLIEKTMPILSVNVSDQVSVRQLKALLEAFDYLAYLSPAEVLLENKLPGQRLWFVPKQITRNSDALSSLKLQIA